MRVKGGIKSRRRHKKILKLVKGYRQARSRLYKVAKESYLHAGQYSVSGRRKRLSQLRSLWILRLNSALRERGLTYSQFIHYLSSSGVMVNRKMLSELVVNYPAVFDKIIQKSKIGV